VAGDEDVADLDYAYLTTTGRVTGRPHRVEIWFALAGGVAYLLSGGRDRADWVRNLTASPSVILEIGDRRHATSARVLDAGDEDELARRLLVQKYQRRWGDDLSDWGRESLAVAVQWR